MKLRLVAVASGALCVTVACSGGGEKESNRPDNHSSAAGAPARAAASPELFTRAIDCAATFDSVSNLFRVIGGTKTGAERDSLMQVSGQRGAAARQMARRAAAIGAELGMARDEIAGRLRQAGDRLLQESRVGDFGDFAGRMGREADRCVAAMPELL